MDKKYRFGLIGRNIAYSFSKGYFAQKFVTLGLNFHSYENFDIETISQFPYLIENNKDLKGLNVTIPYKQEVMDYLDQIDQEAKTIGAVNTVKFTKNGLVGYNTDAYGFQESIRPYLQEHHTRALILGTGGASKAVAYVLESMGIRYQFVSRNPAQNQLDYTELNQEILASHTLLINCTPLGTSPNIAAKPHIPYHFITQDHLLYDLIYNPSKTAFLLEGEKRAATICNGHDML